ncbi:hypothetical protein CkaCkLH20_11724 [Colletotrichum karsti]|uniref:DUF7730 domain-containing protein n=1 Tax=Colletotrichum karsti TaxID=1095194 RepID=A0A9P6LFQ7_9PEZI|nr:uncharacterized protein CkaCkLH20_11724 [Colletotrichum karsti]KAF9870825.1 hypothetical protein CkaCkLH20_11724 [Colletotrichum karsti]
MSTSHHSLDLQQTRLPLRPAVPEPVPRRLTFLDLPYELRLDIYELLLLSAEPVIVSSSRRQLRVKVEPPEHQNAYLRAPRPTPRTVTLNHRKPHVALLQTCRQINREATPLLYRKNDFIVGLKVCASGEARVHPEDLASFFPSLLRPSTILHLPSITFRGACLCHHWLTLAAGEGRTINGAELGRVCGHADGDVAPSIQNAQAAYLMLSEGLWEMEKGRQPLILLYEHVLKSRRLWKI